MIFVLIAVAALGLWLLLLAALAFATRNPDIDPGPPTSELRDESPALVDLITGNWRLCDEAASATLLDLAAKGAVQIEEIGPELSLVRLREPRTPLSAYEKLVHDHVRSLATDGVVATGALAEGARNLGRWWKSFRRKVIVEAREKGLSRARWSRAQAALLTAAAAVPAIAAGIAVAATADGDDKDGGIGAAFVGFALLIGLLGKLNGERGTAEGAKVAGYWMGVRAHLAANQGFAEQPAAAVTIWGRHLAYAAALGLARRAVTSLPISTPADDKRAWSDYGGMWHVVDVRYPRRILWGRPPLQMILRGLVAGLATGFWLWMFGIVASALIDWPDSLVMPVAYLGAAVAAAVPIAFAIADLTTKTEVEGQIVRLRAFQVGSNGNNRPKYAYWVALDDGRLREVKALGIDEDKWRPLVEGDRVRARIGRRVGWIQEIEVLSHSRHRGASLYDDTGEHLLDLPENLGEVPVLGPRRGPAGDGGVPGGGTDGRGTDGRGTDGRGTDGRGTDGRGTDGRGTDGRGMDGGGMDGGGMDGGGTGGQGADGRPAALVTPADLRRTLGIEVGHAGPCPGALPTPAWLAVSSCRYETTAGTPVTVDVHAASGARGGYLMVLGHLLTRVEGREVSGVGGGAMLYPGVISARTSEGTFAIHVHSPAGPPPPDALIALAHTAAERMEGRSPVA
ncbi:hypothetical protein GCM10022226_52450 [Sphaerisporangium flaviroseum]|uniref:Predicted membrane protein YciQ-like C-terminal domain-containing protein n=1 Tax=Sphaerisporangium flaviroseum TaxID=509199 RepID=A0ABP7IRY0_9ACTN